MLSRRNALITLGAVGSIATVGVAPAVASHVLPKIDLRAQDKLIQQWIESSLNCRDMEMPFVYRVNWAHYIEKDIDKHVDWVKNLSWARVLVSSQVDAFAQTASVTMGEESECFIRLEDKTSLLFQRAPDEARIRRLIDRALHMNGLKISEEDKAYWTDHEKINLETCRRLVKWRNLTQTATDVLDTEIQSIALNAVDNTSKSGDIYTFPLWSRDERPICYGIVFERI